MWLPLFLACTAAHPPAPTDSAAPADTAAAPEFLISGAQIVGLGDADILVRDGVIVSVGDTPDVTTPTIVPAEGRWIVPAFIDSHVHIVYRPVPHAMAAGGIAAAVDLAAPTSIFSTDTGPLRVTAAGPMVTAMGGYPTLSWGSGGYGLECAGADQAAQAVTDLHGMGAGVIKLPVTGGNQLNFAALLAAANRAHELDLKVASHATSDATAMVAATAGVDVLAHTPTSPMSDTTLDAFADRAVITTLVAFGNGSVTRANLIALRDRGAVVLYGTDQGNTNPQGILAGEIAAMAQAGMTPAEILAAGTSAPAAYWGLTDLGHVQPGYAASFLVLDEDPLLNPMAVTTPVDVYIDGVRLGP